ncbi:MAG: N-acetyltransferase [Alphaproteobacteria bacterium]|nr:MAG: N-acetyltransferase [Alphaproteobacteria bacterium]
MPAIEANRPQSAGVSSRSGIPGPALPPAALFSGDGAWCVVGAKRLLLRPLMAEDADDLGRLIDAATDEDRLLPCARGQVGSWIDEAERHRRSGEAHTFLLIRRKDPVVLGAANLRRDEDHAGHWQIGYWVAAPYRRQRYCTEAVEALVRFAFDELAAAALDASVPVLNTPSIRLLKRLRFRAVPGVGDAPDVGLWQRARRG